MFWSAISVTESDFCQILVSLPHFSLCILNLFYKVHKSFKFLPNEFTVLSICNNLLHVQKKIAFKSYFTWYLAIPTFM